MDTRVPAEDGGWPSPADPRSGPTLVEQRLAAIEARLDSLERTMQETVTEELHAAGDELRRAVSDLGRLLLRDLDRLTKVLAEHRDAIVDRITALPGSAPGPLPAAEDSVGGQPAATAAAGTGTATGTGTTTATSTTTTADISDESATKRGEDGRWRTIPGRRKGRRSPKDELEGDTRDG